MSNSSGPRDRTGVTKVSKPAHFARGGSSRRTIIAITIILAVVAGVGLAVLTSDLLGGVGRLPSVFAPLDNDARPAKPGGAPGQGQTFLLVGIDSQAPGPTTGSDATNSDFVPGAQRTDVMLMVHVNATRSAATVVGIPRDSWVPIPGRGINKLNAAYSFGGPPLLVATMEQLTRVRIDHLAVVDFDGFQAMTDALGGIDVTSTHPIKVDSVHTLAPGANHLDGVQALAYVREREDLPGGDFDRIRREQNALKAITTKSLSRGTLSSPPVTYNFLNAVTHHVSVDDTLSNGALASLAFGLRDLRGPNITFLSAPSAGTGMEGDQSVVYVDRPRAPQLWQAFDNETITQYLASNPSASLDVTPP